MQDYIGEHALLADVNNDTANNAGIGFVIPDELADESDEDEDRLEQPQGTAEELLACLVGFKIRTNQSDKDFVRLVKIIRHFFPESDHKFPRSIYLGKKELLQVCSFEPEFVVYCCLCNDILKRDKTYQTTGFCPTCEVDLSARLRDGQCQFATLPIRTQIEMYLKNKQCARIFRKFREMTWSHMNGSMHKDIVTKGDIDLSLCIDGAQLNNRMGRGFMPALLVFNNVPVSFQLRFPILAAIFGGKKSHCPPRSVFLTDMAAELRELGEEPVDWFDDLGNKQRSRVFLTTVITDHLEKTFMMNHASHGTKYGCPFCLIEGKMIAAGQFPHALRKHRFRKTAGKTRIGGGHRFPDLRHNQRLGVFPPRSSQERLRIGLEVAEEQQVSEDFTFDKKGIKGIPPLYALPRFDETKSHVVDTLHAMCHGIFHDVMKLTNRGYGKSHHWRKTEEGDVSVFHNLQETLTLVSEADRNPAKIANSDQAWTAYDELQFLLHNVALLCSDEVLFDEEIYKIFIRMSNVVYLSHYGRMTEAIINRCDSEVKALSEEGLKILGEEYLTMKWHLVDGHWVQQMRYHGNASYTDGFNMEKFNYMLKSNTTAKNSELRNITRNFILKNHSRILQRIPKFAEPARKGLQELGFRDFDVESFSDYILKEHKDQEVPNKFGNLIVPVLEKHKICSREEIESREYKFIRVQVLKRKGTRLETASTPHRVDSKIRDSFLQVDGKHFGQIQEIVGLKNEGNGKLEHFLFIMKEFLKIRPTYTSGAARIYPINQFPFRDPVELPDNYLAFLLTTELFIQKCQVCEANYTDSGKRVRIMTVYPNEWFRY
jgi:hypothetical protein